MLVGDECRFQIFQLTPYWVTQGNPDNSCCAVTGSNTGVLGDNATNPSGLYDQLSSCVSLIEIVETCNITCPTCFSESPLGKQGSHLRYTPLSQIKARIEKVLAQKGEIEILQLSGGEPTLHPDLFELVRWAGAHEKIRFIFLNSNGIRFARDAAFTAGFADAFPRGKLLLYWQFDGPQEAGQVELRGTDLRPIRQEILAEIARINLTTILVMTVTNANLAHVYETVALGLKYPNIRAAHFQPVFLSGRTPALWATTKVRPVTTARVLRALIEGSNDFLSAKDFTPLPCGDPNCHVVSGILRPPGLPLIPLGDLVDVKSLSSLANKVHWELSDLVTCGCDNNELGEVLKQFGLNEEHAFAISVKKFMDRGDWDRDRTDRCCTHVINAEGELESFCAYYSKPQPPRTRAS